MLIIQTINRCIIGGIIADQQPVILGAGDAAKYILKLTRSYLCASAATRAVIK